MGEERERGDARSLSRLIAAVELVADKTSKAKLDPGRRQVNELGGAEQLNVRHADYP
jgi:hypothetical protein